MTTVVNNPGSGEGMGVGFIIGIIVAVAILALAVVFGLPAFRASQTPKENSIDVNIKLPTQGGDSQNGAPQQQ